MTTQTQTRNALVPFTRLEAHETTNQGSRLELVARRQRWTGRRSVIAMWMLASGVLTVLWTAL